MGVEPVGCVTYLLLASSLGCNTPKPGCYWRMNSDEVESLSGQESFQLLVSSEVVRTDQ